jgi:hypothetical protein
LAGTTISRSPGAKAGNMLDPLTTTRRTRVANTATRAVTPVTAR